MTLSYNKRKKAMRTAEQKKARSLRRKDKAQLARDIKEINQLAREFSK